MDPITQGALGAVVAQLRSSRSKHLHAAAIGAVGGMLPDLDVLIRSQTDSLLILDYHRQFSHSLLFIPILGCLSGLLMYGLFRHRWRISITEAMLWGTLGCATHGLLDSCTSYGTQLLWPFSDYRVSWDIISIVDPLFTLPIITAIFLTIKFHSARWARVGTAWAIFYLLLGTVQHHRASTLGYSLAESRGHTPIRLEVKPSFSNLIVWKLIYETDDRYYVDALKPGGQHSKIWEGSSTAKLDSAAAFPWLQPGSTQAKDIERFRYFSSGYIALDHDNPLRVVDIRYSMLPQEIKPMWGIELSPGAPADAHAMFFVQREDSANSFRRLLKMISE